MTEVEKTSKPPADSLSCDKIGFLVIQTVPVMLLMGHTSVGGHLYYRGGESPEDEFLKDFLSWAIAPSREERNRMLVEMVRKWYDYEGELSSQEASEIMSRALPNLERG